MSAKVQTQSDIDVAEGLLTKLIDVFIATGMDPAEIALILHRACHRTSRIEKSRGRGARPFEWWAYARVLSCWHQDAKFTDDKGQPRPLRFGGRGNSFSSLVSSVLPGARPKQVLKSLAALQVIKCDETGLIRPQSRNLIVKNPNSMTLRRIAFALNALLTTMLANTVNSRRRKPGSGLFERAAVSENFDLRYLRQFDSVVREHGQALLEMLDEWLSRHEVKKGRGNRAGGHVGAGIYLFASKDRLFEI